MNKHAIKPRDLMQTWRTYTAAGIDSTGEMTTDIGAYRYNRYFGVVFSPLIVQLQIQIKPNYTKRERNMMNDWDTKKRAEYLITRHYRRWAEALKQSSLTDAQVPAFLKGQ